LEIVLYGAGKAGKQAVEIIEKYYKDRYVVSSFVDSYKKESFCGLKISDIENIRKDAIVVITIVNPNQVVEVYKALHKMGFYKIYWFMNFTYSGTEKKDFLKEECWEIKDWSDCILPHMELHLSDQCNLNCKGCTHFSPLYNEIGKDFEQVIHDVKKVKDIFLNVARLDLLGGEPFLNKDLTKYIAAIRKLLPTATIDIFTNGLLIPALSKETLECIKSNEIFISITEYKPTHMAIDKITACLEKFNIKYVIVPYDKRQMFNKPISISEKSKYPNLCISDGCVTVDNGKIARCPTLMYIDKFNEVFKTNLPNQGIFKLDDCDAGSELLEKLKKEVPLCKHCIKCDMEWGVCQKEIKLEDFAVED